MQSRLACPTYNDFAKAYMETTTRRSIVCLSKLSAFRGLRRVKFVREMECSRQTLLCFRKFFPFFFCLILFSSTVIRHSKEQKQKMEREKKKVTQRNSVDQPQQFTNLSI